MTHRNDPSMSARIHFFLLPDKTSARRVRRKVAECGGAIGLIVGTWLELMSQVQSAYLLREPESSWEERLSGVAAGISDAFWSDSHKVASDETEASLGSILTYLLEGVGPDGRLHLPA